MNGSHGTPYLNSFGRLARGGGRRIRRLLSAFADRFLQASITNRLYRRIYSLLLSGEFRDEQFAVVSGKALYRQRQVNKDGDFILRRNIHRIEKGLTYPDRKPAFALGYIGETVEIYHNLAEREAGQDICEDSLRWAHEVLKEFFLISRPDPIIEKSRRLFESVIPFGPAASHLPFRADEEEEPSINFEQLLDLSMKRKSVRQFLAKPVPRELFDKAIRLAANAPSACNRQSFEYRVFDDPQLIERLFRLPVGAKGFGPNIPALVVLIGRLRAYRAAFDRHTIYIDGGLSAMAFLYALECQGISSCCINWPDIKKSEDELRATIRFADDERVIMFIAAGYRDPAGLVPFSRKKSVENLRSYNKQ